MLTFRNWIRLACLTALICLRAHVGQAEARTRWRADSEFPFTDGECISLTQIARLVFGPVSGR